MYNFVASKLSPKVSCSAAALDDYEVTNLISDDALVRSRGFLAFTSIKPPVDIVFNFICDINLKYIKLKTNVGSQKTIGVEILAGDLPTSVGRQLYDGDGLIMCRRNQAPVCNTCNYHLAYFNSHQCRILTHTNKLCIRLFRTDPRSVPCLGAVEVWGDVAQSCSNSTKQRVNNLINTRVNDQVQAKRESKAHVNENSFKIADDFKDAITYEVMAMPMTLPSGNTVDQKTLEKCISNDMTYGRKPADPFTGLEFLPNRKPVMNVPLKSRIDLFLLQNANTRKTFGIARTLGPNRSTNVPSLLPASKKFKLECEPSTGDDLDEAIAKVVSSSSFICYTKDSSPQQQLIKSCGRCETKSHLYAITTCNHCYCKPCIILLNNVCVGCKLKFDNNNVVKLNF